jgi:hypothetical protein
LVWRGRWAREEHINVQELRVISKTMRRLSLEKASWGSKVIVATDSLVSLGCVNKGRSSKFPLLRQCRMLASLSLGLRLRVLGRYLESERNPADGPSRFQRVGAALETQRAHQGRAQQREALFRQQR